MRRVLHIIDASDSTEAATRQLVLAGGHKDEGFQVQIAALGKVPRGDVAAFPIATLGRRWTIDPLAFLRLRRLIRRFQPDIVHTWDLDSALYGSAAMAGRTPRPHLVIGLNRIKPWTPEWQWFLTRRLVRHADRLVTNSPNVREWYVAHGLPVGKFTEIPPGVPAARPSEVLREELLRELQFPPDARFIGVVGRLVPENRVKDLIWAADLLRVLHDNLRVLIIGDGPLRPQLEEYARLASDLDHIQFLGERNDAWRIMPHLDVLWNASENVGPSATILEAMAASVPVVASDTPTNRELVVENETGFLIPLGTRAGRAARARHTDRIFTDADLAARLSRAAHQRAAEQFCMRRCVQKYSELYAEICP